jgi:tetratricopeptide (TPR) repeat protein
LGAFPLQTFVGLISGVIACLVGAGWLLHHLYFVALPRRAVKKYADTDPERLRRYLERVVATPSLMGKSMKLVPHLLLVGHFLPKARHAEAAGHCRAVLDIVSGAQDPERFGPLEANTRRKLADCLEALGQHDEAAEELRLAGERIDHSSDDTRRYLAEGALLERQDRHDEAYQTYERALKTTAGSNTPGRVKCMMHLVVSAHRAGRIAECLSWAEQVIALGAKGNTLRNAHRMAGVALGELGQLDESESHQRRAYDLAVAAGNTPAAAEILGTLADCLFKRGQLAEANEAAIRAAATDPNGVRLSLFVQAQVFNEWGRFEEALAFHERYREGVPMATPFRERRILAVHTLAVARAEAECGRVEDAWRRVEGTLPELAADAKLDLRGQAIACWILAARGLADQSRGVAARVEARLGDFAGDPSTRRVCLYYLARAACTRGDHQDGIAFWTRYLAAGPDPVYHPTAFFLRGECHRQLGRPSDARTDYRAAAATNLDTHHARLARRQLGEVTLL